MSNDLNTNTETLELKSLPAEELAAEYLRLTKLDIAESQKHLDELPESERRGLTLDTYRHFNCGYLKKWVLTKSRAELACGVYIKKETGKVKRLPPESERIIIPTSSMEHFNAVATPRARRSMNKDFWKQHARDKELFGDPDALNADTIVIVEGELDAMSIWQATRGEVAVVAILGCDNFEAALGKKLPELKGKRFVILLDSDTSGRKSAKKVYDALINAQCPAGIHSLHDYLPSDIKTQDQAGKIDANDILIRLGEERLNQIIRKILVAAEDELKFAEEQIAKKQKEIESGHDASELIKCPAHKTSKAQAQKSQSPKTNTDYDDDPDTTRKIITEALKFVHAKDLERDDWFAIGCVLKYYGFKLEDFDAWSNDGDPRYSASECVHQWDTIQTAEELKDKKSVKAGTLIKLAQANGFELPPMDGKKKSTRAKLVERLKELNEQPVTAESIAEIQKIIRRIATRNKDKNGNPTSIKGSEKNLSLIFKYDPNIRGLVGYDEFGDVNTLLKTPPWKHVGGDEWTDADEAQMRLYLRRNYDDLNCQQLIGDMTLEMCLNNSFNVVKKFFESLPKWDGVKRAETLFVDFLKVPDTPYAREVTLNWLTAAVARIYNPGCRYQTALVLHGNQKIGKSYIIERLGGSWYLDLTENVDDSHAEDAVTKGWIVEIKEMSAMRKAEINATKAFIERFVVSRRLPYEKKARTIARHCVFAITVNDSEFLRDTTGNRRYMILHSDSPMFGYVEGLTDEYISQIWAEVYHHYNELFKDGFDE
ncbi:MAG: toprim domain-containing protein, partial [Selenomonadaceae bacterium]|nr:toprim domain-containing protein [Selenomonadaceae bacterium]